jgi:hypothetical protein
MATAGALRNLDPETFSRVWLARHIPREKIAERLGVTPQAVSLKAKTLGLPPRRDGSVCKTHGRDDLFARMWLAGVDTAEIARYFGYSHRSAVSMRRQHLGLPPRTKGKSGKRNGGWAATISLATFFEEEMRRQMEGGA